MSEKETEAYKSSLKTLKVTMKKLMGKKKDDKKPEPKKVVAVEEEDEKKKKPKDEDELDESLREKIKEFMRGKKKDPDEETGVQVQVAKPKAPPRRKKRRA